MPRTIEPNTTDYAPSTLPTGFVITLDGQTLAADPVVRDVVRRTDVRLADADIQVVFDGLGAVPRLDLEVVGDPQGYRAGDTVTVQSALNYPAYVASAEVRLIDLDSRGGPRTLAVVPVTPNGQASFQVPEGGQIVAVHRVYDARGRYDETHPIPISDPDRRLLIDGVEDGSDNRARVRIPVHGGAVTVSGTSVVRGAQVTALGEAVQPDPSGGFVLQRILPPGDYGVDVRVAGPGQHVDLVRDVEIPRSEWFSTGRAELTLGWRDEGYGETRSWNSAMFAFYVDGRTANGYSITAAANTGEGDLEDIFARLQDRDPRTTIQRIDPDDLYPTYGDDSTLVDDTPTSGRLYLRIEREGNFLLWGDFDAGLDGNQLVRNDRSLYGAQAYWASPDQTARGEARAVIQAYAANPEMLPQRDAFIGTGGSVYVLQRQDIGIGSEILSVEVRDPVTGRLIETVRLEPGRDYQVNYLQGIVTLSAPLASQIQDRSIISTPGETPQLRLVVQYEYTPTLGDVDGYAYGGRAEVWLTDDVRVGISGMSEETGIADQVLIGADLHWRIGENSHVTFEYAESDGPGFGSALSADGGFVFDTIAPNGGSGTAMRADVHLDFADLGLAGEGVVGGYAERREVGFSSLDYEITATTGTEQLWGVFLDAQASEDLRYSLSYDSYDNAVGEHDRTATGEVEWAINDRYTLGLALEHLDRERLGSLARLSENGRRTDLGARLTYNIADERSVYIFGQATVDAQGLEENNRIGVGADYALNDYWTLNGEISGGTQGPGGLLRFSYADGEGSVRYIGYELDPGRTISGVTLTGRDNGQIIAGAQQRVNGQLSYFGENTYDMFGRYRSLTTAYGLTYQATEYLSYTGAVEFGTINDRTENDFDRTALSFGMRYEDEMLAAGARLEYRVEDGLRSGATFDSSTLALTADARYLISDNARVLLSFEGITTDTDESSILNGDFIDFSVGYAYRPIDTDRLNVLMRYRYLYDDIGQRLDDTDTLGPRQRSHVFSADANYLIDERWRVGGRLGFRLSQTALDETTPYTDNDAWIASLNARYHLLHNWDALAEMRNLTLIDAGTSETSFLGAVTRQLGENFAVELGYNFGTFSDDLTDLTRNHRGLFLNFRASF